MNEQLIVKNFGPIKDATVDFKKVTVFIGPTGGGKSTLAKLKAVFQDDKFFFNASEESYTKEVAYNLALYGIQNFGQLDSDVQWHTPWFEGGFGGEKGGVYFSPTVRAAFEKEVTPKLQALTEEYGVAVKNLFSTDTAFRLSVKSHEAGTRFWQIASTYFPFLKYIPADRALAAFVTGSVFRLQSQKAGVSSVLIDFLAAVETARDALTQESAFDIPFLNAYYRYQDGQHLVSVRGVNSENTTTLAESASGFQSAIPLLMVTAFDAECHSTSFIIEEPELNLYPTAQQGLLNWLVEKCTVGENDLTITTHSPYILAHLNLLLYAYQVAEKHPERADDVAKIVPRESWINPKEFAAYHVEGQKENGVHSIVNPETGLISYNDLDALAGNSATEFDQLLDINAGLEVE